MKIFLQPRFLHRHSVGRNDDAGKHPTHSDMRGATESVRIFTLANNERWRRFMGKRFPWCFFHIQNYLKKGSCLAVFFKYFEGKLPQITFNLMKYHTASANSILTSIYIHTLYIIYYMTYIISLVSVAFISDVLELPWRPFFSKSFLLAKVRWPKIYRNFRETVSNTHHDKGSTVLAQVAVLFWKWYAKTKVD